MAIFASFSTKYIDAYIRGEGKSKKVWKYAYVIHIWIVPIYCKKKAKKKTAQNREISRFEQFLSTRWVLAQGLQRRLKKQFNCWVSCQKLTND